MEDDRGAWVASPSLAFSPNIQNLGVRLPGNVAQPPLAFNDEIRTLPQSQSNPPSFSGRPLVVCIGLSQTVGFGDDLYFERLPKTADQDEFECNMDGVPTDRSNLVLRALDLFRRKTNNEDYYKVKYATTLLLLPLLVISESFLSLVVFLHWGRYEEKCHPPLFLPVSTMIQVSLCLGAPHIRASMAIQQGTFTMY